MNPEGLYFICPVCGTDVPRAAKSCPECGACDKSGWSEDARYDGLDLPEIHGDQDLSSPSGTGLKDRAVWIIALLMLIAFAWLVVRGAW